MKNFSIGTDIVDIKRFNKLDMVKNSLFLKRIFTQGELNYCFAKKKAAPYLAVRFAGKEAVIKALSSFTKQVINYKDVEIVKDSIGIPMVQVNNQKFKNIQIKISLSHSYDKAIAFVLAIKK